MYTLHCYYGGARVSRTNHDSVAAAQQHVRDAHILVPLHAVIRWEHTSDGSTHVRDGFAYGRVESALENGKWVTG